jgi:exo-beta-1,3-glucanase (GH17 family)
MRVMLALTVLACGCQVCILSAGSDSGDTASALSGNRWIAYAPTAYYPSESPPVLPGRESVRADLEVLRRARFTGLVTYSSQLEVIPSVAETLGFRAMLLGVWDPLDPGERAQALRMARAHSDLIIGLVVGNEGLLSGRYTVESLCKAMREIHAETGKPVTTTEPVDLILSESRIAGCSDFVTVNAHPYFSNHKEPATAVRWTLEAWEAVRSQYPDKVVLFKEVGLPTAGDDGLSEEAQKDYYLRLAQTPVVFCYFEAFDASPRFKPGLIEQSWGLWKSDRTPKAIVESLPWKAEK